MAKSIHHKIVTEIIEEQKKDRSVIAVTLFGSLARGKERANSDVDIEIISTSAKKWQLLKQNKYGIKIDFVICPKKHLLRQMEKYPYLCYDYLHEKIIYDPQGFMKKVKKKLKGYFDGHPEAVEFWKNKLKIMKRNKQEGHDLKNAIKSYDEAEIRFSKEKKVTRNFFRS